MGGDGTENDIELKVKEEEPEEENEVDRALRELEFGVPPMGEGDWFGNNNPQNEYND